MGLMYGVNWSRKHVDFVVHSLVRLWEYISFVREKTNVTDVLNIFFCCSDAIFES